MRRYIPEDAKPVPEDAERVFEGVIYDVWQWDQKLYDGSMAKFEILKRPDTVVALCVKGDKVVVVEEEQPHRGRSVGLPGGRVDVDSETELDAVKREVKEETGMMFSSWKLVYAKQATSKIDHLFYIFIASDYQGTTEANHDAGEKITVKEYDFEEFKVIALADNFAVKLPKAFLEAYSLDEVLQIPALDSE